MRPGSHPPSGDGQGFGNGCEGAGASTTKLHIVCFSFFLSFFLNIYFEDIFYVVCKLSPKMQIRALVFRSSKAATKDRSFPSMQEGRQHPQSAALLSTIGFIATSSVTPPKVPSPNAACGPGEGLAIGF